MQHSLYILSNKCLLWFFNHRNKIELTNINLSISKLLIIHLFIFFYFHSSGQTRRLYIANDDHTDYMWTADEATYQKVFITTIDKYLKQIDSTITKGLPDEHQSRYNLDGNFWIWNYEKFKTSDEVNNLINRIIDGHISVPLNPLVILYGGTPAEATLRGMFYAGRLERRFNLKINLAVSMENTVLPLGLSSLWAGCGAKYSWKGICGCASKLKNSSNTDLNNRENEIYYYRGLDDQSVLMKWYSLSNNQFGGYAEAMNLSGNLINVLNAKCTATGKLTAGAFGFGSDNLESYTNGFITFAKNNTNTSQRIIVSNEEDFFKDYEATYGSSIAVEQVARGNEWEILVSTLAETSAKVKRSIEKLRIAEAMATIAAVNEPSFCKDLEVLRDSAWMSVGLYWEHDWTADGIIITNSQRAEFQKKLERTFSMYVDSLYNRSLSRLSHQIIKAGMNKRFFVFNALNWGRTDIADFAYSGSLPVKVIDVTSGQEVLSQVITKNSVQYIRIQAKDVPSVGYKIFEVQFGNPAISSPVATLTGNVFENSYFKLTITRQGVVTSLIDKINGNRELVSNISGRYFNDMGSGSGETGSNLAMENIGPVSATLKTSTTKKLDHTSSFTLYRDILRVDIENYISQNIGDSVLTNSFSLNIPSPTIWHEESGAVIKAKTTDNGGNYAVKNARCDWLTMNHYANVSNSIYNATISNRDCYFMKVGNSTVKSLDESSSQINVLVGGKTESPYSLGINNQYGNTQYTQQFSIFVHNKTYDQTTSMKESLEAQTPFVTGEVVGPNNILPADNYSFLNTSNPDVILWALKPAEEGMSSNGLVARFWNMSGQKQNNSLTFSNMISSGNEVTHIETDIPSTSLHINGHTADITNGINQMQSYRIKLIPDTQFHLKEFQNDSSIKVFPNPTSQFITIQLPNSWNYRESYVTIFNEIGQVVGEHKVSGHNTVIDTQALITGNYFLIVLDKSFNKIAKGRFIIKK
jgi:alpha-mannosidase